LYYFSDGGFIVIVIDELIGDKKDSEMQKIDKMEALRIMCRTTNKWGMYIGIGDWLDTPNFLDELVKAAPYLDNIEDYQIISDEMCYLLFDTEEEMDRIFEMTVGDDGPTRLNKYNGQVRVYAITCDNNGELMNTNT